MLKILLLLGCAVLISGAAFAENPVIEFEGRYWMPDLDADVSVVESGVGSDFDAKDDLGLDDESFPEGRITWHTGPNSRLRLGYLQADYSSSETITRSIEFSGQTYTAGALVNSDLEVAYLRLGWTWQFINLLEDKLKMGTIVEAKGILADVSLDAPNLGINQSEEFTGGLPTLGVALNFVPIRQVNLFGEISGLPAGDYGYFFDAEAGIEYRPFRNFSLVGGYRIIDLKVEDEPDFIEMQLAGPFVGGKIMF